jgi:hypothetical protein
MGKPPREWIIVAILFAMVLLTRMLLLAQTSTFESETYFVLRQAETIRETGMPLFSDPLSYSGRVMVFVPLFHYLIAFFGLIMPIELAAEIVSSICISSLVIIAYAIARHITKSKAISLTAGFFTGFIPALYLSVESITPNHLSLALAFLLSYCILRIEEKGFATLAIIVAILANLASPQVFIILTGLLFYFILLVMEKSKPSNKEVEIALFMAFLSIWFYILLYKKALLANGLQVFWNNTPAPLIASYFTQASFLGILYALGVVPLFLGIYAIYHVVFETRHRQVMLYVGFLAASFVFIWMRIIPLKEALLFFGINMAILSSYTLKVASNALSRTKMDKATVALGAGVVILFVLSSITPFIAAAAHEPTPTDDIKALEWLKVNTEKDSVVIAPVGEGFLINYFSERRNVADENFLFQKDAPITYSEINAVYKQRLASEAIRILNKHDADYILLSTATKESFNITRLFYDDNECFSIVYGDGENKPVIYRFAKCRIGE